MSKLFSWFGKKKTKEDEPTPEAESTHSDDQSQAESPESEPAAETASDSFDPHILGEPSPMPSEPEAHSVEHRLETPPSDDATTDSAPSAPANPHTIAEPSPMPSESEAHSVDHQVSGDEVETDDAESTSHETPEGKHAAFNPHTLAEPSPMPSEAEADEAEHLQPEPQEGSKLGFFSRLKQRLSKTSANLGDGLVGLFKGKKIDDELFEELETQLLVADVGINTTTKIIDDLTDKADRAQLKDGDALYQQLKHQLSDMLGDVSQPLAVDDQHEGPFVILMVGVNGVGKTTTIGKLAKQFRQQGKSVMLAAGDTFRAAAVEQLQTWGERNDIPVVAQHTGADSASVIYDALSAAKARGTDILIADTAGRLQNKANLMTELEKIVRVMRKLDANAPHEIMLALDATTGQNALSQARLFNEAVGLTGLCITKLDGTAKGGVLFALADQFGIPIRYIGIGESIDDLRPFDGEQFVEALFSESAES